MPETSARLEGIRLKEWLGANARSEREFVALVESGLPTTTVAHMEELGLEKSEVFTIVHPRTLKHRKSRKQHLSPEESERALRMARLLSQAESVWGSRESALIWMRAPKRRFDGRTPFDLLRTEPGGRLVEEMLTQIDEGMFA